VQQPGTYFYTSSCLQTLTTINLFDVAIYNEIKKCCAIPLGSTLIQAELFGEPCLCDKVDINNPRYWSGIPNTNVEHSLSDEFQEFGSKPCI